MAIDISRLTSAGATAPASANSAEKKKEEKNVGGLLGGIGYLGEKAAVGFVQSVEGIADYTSAGLAKLFGADDFAEKQMKEDWFGDWYTHPDEWYKPGKGWQFAGDIASGIGSSVPSLAVGIGATVLTAASGGTAAPATVPMLAGAFGGGITAGLSAAGGATKEAYSETGELGGKEFGYGLLSGVVEGGTEALTNALSLGTGAIIKNVGKSIAKEAVETVSRQTVVKGLIGSFAGEAFEEGFATWISPTLKRATYDKNAKNASFGEITYSAITSGIAGMVMDGGNIAINAAANIKNGASAVNQGFAPEILGLSQRIASFENANKTGNEAYEAVAQTYKKLSDSIAKTGGEIRTTEQMRLLGELQRGNTAAVFTPMVTRSAAEIYANAEAIAQRLTEYGYTDKPVTAEDIRKGVDPEDAKSFSAALKENTLLRELAVADVTGHLIMNTRKFRDATLAGKNYASQADLNRFAETATPEEIRAVSEALGIESWETLTPEQFEQKVVDYMTRGGENVGRVDAAVSDNTRTLPNNVGVLPNNVGTMPNNVGTMPNNVGTVPGTGVITDNVGVITDNVGKSNNDIGAVTRRNAQTAEDFARANVRGYNELSATNQGMIRKVIRAANASGISQSDAKTYAEVSAHSGIDIVFDKEACRVGDTYADGYYDADRNRIVVNPEGTRSAEKLLLHELDHAIRLAYGKDGRAALVKEAYLGISPEEAQKITAKYRKIGADTATILDEANAYFAETALSDAGVLERLWQKEKTLGEKIVEFFTGTKEAYKGEKKLEGAAKRYEKLYREMFRDFAEKNRGRNAAETRGGTGEKRYSFSSIAYSFFGDGNVSVADMESGKYKDTEGYRAYVDQCLSNMAQTVPELSPTEAKKEVEKSIDGIVRVAVAMKKAGYDILDDQRKRSTRDSKDRLLFSSLEPNSDYFTSSDISTICDKRLNFTGIYEEIVRREEALGVNKGKRFFDNVDNYFAIHKIMADKGLTQPCRQCYVESMRKNLAPMANAFLRLVQESDPNNKANDQIYHTSGKNKGLIKTNNAKLREDLLSTIDREKYEIRAENLTVEMLTTADGLADIKLRAPLIYEAFNSFYGQSKPKMPKAATPFRFGELTALLTDENGKIKKGTVKKIVDSGGFRLQSYSDFQVANFADVLQVIFEAGTLGLNGHAYTKVPAFLDATKGTNLKRNISIFMYQDGGVWKIDRNDSFPYDLDRIYGIVESDETGNTGIIAVSQNEDMSSYIMANDRIGYFIPFHKSGMKMGTVRETVVREGGREIKGYSRIKDHTRQQTEVWARSGDDHKALTKVKKAINIYDFWDFDNVKGLSKNKLIEKNVKKYIDACETAGYLPKFREYVMNNEKILAAVLEYSKELGFSPKDATVNDISFTHKGYRIPYGYYKCLGDFGMFTPAGKASPIERLSLAEYDFVAAEKFFTDASTLRRNEILQQISNGEERERYRRSDLSSAEIADIVRSKRQEVADEVIGKRYALPEEDIGDIDAILGELYGEGIDIHRGTALVDTLPVIPESPRGKRYSRAEAMKIVDSLVSADYLKKKQKKDMVSSVFSAMNGLEDMAQISEYADTFAKFYVDKLMQIRIEHGDVPEYARQLSLLRMGMGKISFTPADIAKLRASLGREAAKNFLNRWARQGYDGVYPADVFLADLQQAYPEIADRIDGKTPMDALMAVNEMYDAAKERTGSGRYFKLYPDQSIEWQNMMARDIYNSIMQGFVSADKAVAAQALRRAEDNADFWQAKFDEGRVTDREFNEGFREKLKTEKSENAKLKRDVKRVERERDYFQAKREEDIAADREFRERQKEAYKTQTKALRDSKAEAEKRAKIAEKDLAEAIKKQKYAESVAENEQIRADYYQYEIQQRQEEYKREREEAELRHFDKLVAESNKRINAEEKAKQTKLAAREAEKSLTARGHISATVDKLQDMKKNRFTSAAEYQGNTFDKIVGELAKVERGGKFSPTKAREAMKLLADWYMPENPLFAELAEDDPDAWIKDIHEMVKSLANSEGAFTSEQLGTMDNVLRYFVNYIKKYNKVFYNGKLVEATGLAEEFVGLAKEAKKYMGGAFFRSVGKSYIETFADPATVVRRMDGYRNGFYTQMLEQFRAGAIKSDVNYYNLTKRYEEFMDKNKNYLREAEKATVKFEGRDIPKMQAIGLYMTMKREHAHLGLLFNGFAYLDGDGEKVRVNGFAEAELSPEDAIGVIAAKRRKLEEAFTPEDIEYISILEKVYNEDARALKASRDMQRYGFTNAMDDYYYPIRRANTLQKVDTGDSGELDRVSSASFNKDIVTGAAGELLIENADTLFRRHARAVSQYEALSPAIEAYNKIFNLDVSGNKNKPVSVRTVYEERGENGEPALWVRGTKYMRDLVEDVQGIKRDRSEGMELLGKIRSGYAKFQLGANPKTLASQISSIFASSSVLDYDAILGSTNISGKDVDDYCTLAMLRNADNTAAMAQGNLTPAQRASRKIDTVSDALMKPIGMVDRFVVTRLFAACQKQIELRGGEKVGTVQNKVEAGKLMEKVIIETQQNSFATERSAAMRSGNEFYRTVTMFTSDAMKTVGRAIDAFGEVSVLRKRAKAGEKVADALAAAKKQMMKSTLAMAAVAAYSAAIAQFFRWLYNKDKDEDETVVGMMITDFGAAMLGGLPIIKEVYAQFTDGYGLEDYTLASFNDLLAAVESVTTFVPDIITGKAGAEDIPGKVRSLAYAVGQFTGLPVRNVYNMLYGITKRVAPNAAYRVDDFFANKNYTSDLRRAVESGDEKRAYMLMGIITGQRIGDMSEEAAAELHRLAVAGHSVMPRHVSETFTVDGEEYTMTADEMSAVSEIYGASATEGIAKLTSSKGFTSLSDTAKADAVKYVYQVSYDMAIADTYSIDRGNAALIADAIGVDAVALAYAATKGITSDTDRKGKTVEGSKRKKVIAAIQALPISTEEKLLLICAKGYAIKDGDVRGMSAQAAKARLKRYVSRFPNREKLLNLAK